MLSIAGIRNNQGQEIQSYYLGFKKSPEKKKKSPGGGKIMKTKNLLGSKYGNTDTR